MADHSINYYSTQKNLYLTGINSFKQKGKKIHHGDCGIFMEMTSLNVIFYRAGSLPLSQ